MLNRGDMVVVNKNHLPWFENLNSSDGCQFEFMLKGLWQVEWRSSDERRYFISKVVEQHGPRLVDLIEEDNLIKLNLNGGLGLAGDFPANPHVLKAFIGNDERFGVYKKLTIGQLLAN